MSRCGKLVRKETAAFVLAALLSCAFFFNGHRAGAAENLRIRKLVYEPADFGSGEEVVAIAQILSQGSSNVDTAGIDLQPGAGLPERLAASDPEILSGRLAANQDGFELRLRFIPWSPGKGILSGMTVAGRSLPDLPYVATPRLESGARDLMPPRPQLEPPGAALYLYALAGIALSLIFAIFVTLAWLLPAARFLLARWRAGQAFRRLKRSLDYLAVSLREDGEMDAAAFYAALSRSFRLYLEERVEPCASALTPREFCMLSETRFPAPGIRDAAAELLAEADRVRYAGEASLSATMFAAVDKARRLGSAAEEGLDARR
jgi:hypothetical protein